MDGWRFHRPLLGALMEGFRAGVGGCGRRRSPGGRWAAVGVAPERPVRPGGAGGRGSRAGRRGGGAAGRRGGAGSRGGGAPPDPW
jgi:hypothetical protein